MHALTIQIDFDPFTIMILLIPAQEAQAAQWMKRQEIAPLNTFTEK